MLDCPRAQAQFNDFLEGTLTAAQSVALMAHLRECRDCAREFQALKATQTLLRGASLPDGEAARDRVMARFRHSVGAATAPEPVCPIWWRRPLPLGMATAAAALLILLTVLPFTNSGVPNTEASLTGGLESLALPSSDEIDNMTALHAAQSASVLNSADELQHEALADANSRLILPQDEAE
jgi:anti-sigma factor RsiW